ncbi:ribonuclease P protein component [Robertkochia aurantiaca]|uniref:ribonuclease P protein component n=1 Tax=Robertkochia aurantiaca TaxID=2873700 RepID=UPI001CCBA5D6|nr:ribonuclease P protein component [Robertkochia sp. 3YJGBD-33]
MRYTFPRIEKLKSRKLIASVFTEGSSHAKYPIRLVWLETELPEAVVLQAAFSVPKRHFKKAVDRNRIKRLMREAYRLQKPQIEKDLKKQYALVFIYTGKGLPDYAAVEKSMKNLLYRLAGENDD